ncbi:MAG: PepSY domain-containing protein [Pseudomonadales bacterium]
MRKRLRSRSKFRAPLMRWHRRIGVTVSVLVIWLSVTGILLNHSDQLHLKQVAVEQPLLMSIYGVERPTPTSYASGGHWFSHLGGNHIFLDGEEVAYCSRPLSGVVWYRQQFVISCGDGLLLMTATGEVVEHLGSAYGFPEPISGLAVMDDQLLLNTMGGVVVADPDQLQWQPYQQQDSIEWVVANQTPEKLMRQLQPHLGSELDWERVLLDLHSGRLGSQFGRWLMDSAAVLLILLACSGVWVWVRRPSRFTKH